MVKDQSQNAREDYVNEDNVNLLILISITLYPVTTQTHYLSKKNLKLTVVKLILTNKK